MAVEDVFLQMNDRLSGYINGNNIRLTKSTPAASVDVDEDVIEVGYGTKPPGMSERLINQGG